jgi:hypothetical protein
MDGLVIVLAILFIGTSTYSFLQGKKLKEQVATLNEKIDAQDNFNVEQQRQIDVCLTAVMRLGGG